MVTNNIERENIFITFSEIINAFIGSLITLIKVRKS